MANTQNLVALLVTYRKVNFIDIPEVSVRDASPKAAVLRWIGSMQGIPATNAVLVL